MRRAASSVPTNIAEGSKRVRPKEYGYFLNIAEGSIGETEYLLILSRDLGLINAGEAADLVQEASEIAQMLFSLREKVEQGASFLREEGD
jgi:four helix bundle protein